MPVRDFLKSLSGTYQNRCPGLTETRIDTDRRLLMGKLTPADISDSTGA